MNISVDCTFPWRTNMDYSIDLRYLQVNKKRTLQRRCGLSKAWYAIDITLCGFKHKRITDIGIELPCIFFTKKIKKRKKRSCFAIAWCLENQEM